MGMTLGAAHRQPQPDRPGGIDAVLDGGGAELLVVGPPFGIGHRVAVEGRGHALVEGRAGKQVARELFDGELIIREVVVEGVDDPVAVAPDRAQGVGAVPGRVGVARQVEPDARPALAVGGVFQETIHGLFISIGRRIGGEFVHFPRRRRQAAQVNADAAQEDELVSLGGGREPFFFEPGEYPVVDPVTRPWALVTGRQGLCPRGRERPVLRIRGALPHPASEDLYVRLREPLAGFFGRHPQRLILLDQSGEQLALVRRSGDDRDRPTLERLHGLVAMIEPERAAALGFVGAVAGEAIPGEDRPDLAQVIDRRVGLLRRRSTRVRRRSPDHEQDREPGPGAA